jgi:RNA polymerase sigma-70 factor (ECF subfamily)
MIHRGILCLGHSAQGDTISEYHLEAGIAACHSTAPDDAGTDWPRILALYDQLLTLKPSPIAAMNRAVAVARVHGPQAGMDALDAITDRSKLESHHLYHAIRGTFAAELGDHRAALTHFRQAGNLATLPAERDFIARRIGESGGCLTQAATWFGSLSD